MHMILFVFWNGGRKVCLATTSLCWRVSHELQWDTNDVTWNHGITCSARIALFRILYMISFPVKFRIRAHVFVFLTMIILGASVQPTLLILFLCTLCAYMFVYSRIIGDGRFVCLSHLLFPCCTVNCGKVWMTLEDYGVASDLWQGRRWWGGAWIGN